MKCPICDDTFPMYSPAHPSAEVSAMLSFVRHAALVHDRYISATRSVLRAMTAATQSLSSSISLPISAGTSQPSRFAFGFHCWCGLEFLTDIQFARHLLDVGKEHLREHILVGTLGELG